MATLKSNLKEALGWVWTCALGCIVIVVTVCVWVLQSTGVKVAILALWPSLGKVAWPVAAIVGFAMTLLMVLGAEAAKNMIEEIREKQRKLRFDAIERKQILWLARLGDIREKPSWDLEEIYWDGIKLREEFIISGDSDLTEKHRALKSRGFNQALEDLAAALKEKGLDVTS